MSLGEMVESFDPFPVMFLWLKSGKSNKWFNCTDPDKEGAWTKQMLNVMSQNNTVG